MLRNRFVSGILLNKAKKRLRLEKIKINWYSTWEVEAALMGTKSFDIREDIMYMQKGQKKLNTHENTTFKQKYQSNQHGQYRRGKRNN